MRIAIVANQVAGGWSPLEDQGWSGGEEIVAKFSTALAARSHDVSVVYDGPRLEVAGVRYVPRAEAGGFQADVAVYFKCPECAGLIDTPRSYVWTDQERPFVPDPFVRVVACSQYLARVLASMTPRLEERLTVIPYGIDCAEVLAAGEGVERNPLEVLHCASPDRGLDVFLESIWPQVLAREPKAILTIAYGWELFDKYGGSPVLKARIQAILAALPADSWTMQRYTRAEHHALFHRASVYAYWCTGGEQFGLTGLKAQLAGCVPVVKPWGALHETIEQMFHITNVQRFAAQVAGMLTAPAQYAPRMLAPLPSAGPLWHPSDYDWPRIADHWERLWDDTADAKPLTSAVLQVPAPPPFAEPIGYNLPALAHPALMEWLHSVGSQRPWIDPTLGFAVGPAPSPSDADAVVLGWALEDGPEDAATALRHLGLKPAQPCFLLVSHGTWRQEKRKRALSRDDLLHILASQQDVQLRAFPLNTDGDGVTVATFKAAPYQLVNGRATDRLMHLTVPRDTLSACFIVRNVADTFTQTLQSIQKIVDEVVVVDTGVTDSTPDRVEDWRKATGIPVQWVTGTSPRYCWDCLSEHPIGAMGYGHRMAGFETPRNESIALAKGDHILWMDADEEMLNPEAIHKYLRNNCYAGYGIPQHHHSVHPPEASKVDYPVRLFRRVPDATQPAGLFPFGSHAWPTMHSGLTARFTGIVHEHPGHGPLYTEGLGPVIILSDMWISHRGYMTEDIRRRRFVRNWPLMVSDRQKYPARRLGRFLWIRDLSHQARYLVESAGNVLTHDAAQLATEACELFTREFAGSADAYCADALQFATACMQMLNRGIEFVVDVKARKPEIGGEQTVVAQFNGRFDTVEQVIQALRARLGEVSQWTGAYV